MVAKNRQEYSIDMLDVEIEHLNGVFVQNLNDIAMVAAFGDYPDMAPIKNLKSELSGKPAFFVRVDDVQMALSFEELDRFIRHDLKKKEVEKLLNTYGSFHAISGSFYSDYMAWQPMEIAPATKNKIESIKKQERIKKFTRKLRNNLKEKEPEGSLKKNKI